jgi:hypothetical protein
MRIKKNWLTSLGERDHSEDLGINGRITLNFREEYLKAVD